MAASSLLLLLFAAAAAMLISPALSQICTSQTFPRQTFPNCSDLPVLNATLHWSYNASALTISLAFTVSRVENVSWIAHGLNPSGSGMAGTQALAAFAAANGSFVVHTYNITSPGPIAESPIGYNVSLLSAARSGNNNMTIFSTWQLPAGESEFNHTWQVGDTVTGGVPQAHAMDAANLAATGVLRLAGGAADTPAVSPAAGPSGTVSPTGGSTPAGSPGTGGGSTAGNHAGGGARVWGGVYGVLVLLFIFNFGF